MAFDQTITNGYGTGALGAVTNPAGQINSYANVTGIGTAGTNQITIGTPLNGVYETFAVGKEIMLHASAVASGTDATKSGKSMVATITAVAGSVLTLSADPTTLFVTADLTPYIVQAFTIAQFDTLTLSSGSIAPIAYSIANKYGGILAFKCKTSLVLSGGTINLVDKGIPVANLALRLLTAQETEMTTTGKTTGWENHITARQFLLNSGDGAVFIGAKLVDNTLGGATTRIGNITAGVAYFPYGASLNTPTLAKGGSTILIVADSILNFLPSIISKGKNAGAGYGRCYIATNTLLPNDEGLYAQDCISDKTRLVNTLGVKDFGDGILGTIVNPSGQLNSYVPVTAIIGNLATVNMANVSNGIYDTFVAGSEVMFYVSTKVTSGTDSSLLGKFFCTKILSVNGNTITFAIPVPFTVSLTDYSCQLVTVPRFGNLTISTSYTGTLAWDNIKKIGGILALKANGLLDLSGGQINLVNKGLTKDNILRPVLTKQCSGQQKDSLPISQGNGAIFIVAKQLLLNSASRIGATGDGSLFGGDNTYSTTGGGYCGFNGTGYGGHAGGLPAYSATGDVVTNTGIGELGANGGASIFAVLDTITNFTQKAFSTGGQGGTGGYTGQGPSQPGKDGGAGYGGGGVHYQDNVGSGTGEGGTGGYAVGGGPGGSITNVTTYGGGGGGGGTCFIYCNSLTTADYTGVVV